MLKALVNKFDEILHGAMLREVFQLRDMQHFALRGLPKHGFVFLSNETLIAAAFIRLMEGDYALLDGLISNPNFSSRDRNLGIESVIKALTHFADEKGILSILSYSLDASTLERSKSHGFEVMPHRFIVRGLKKGV